MVGDSKGTLVLLASGRYVQNLSLVWQARLRLLSANGLIVIWACGPACVHKVFH